MPRKIISTIDYKQEVINELVRGKILDVGCAAAPNPTLHIAVGLDIAKARLPPNYDRFVQHDLNGGPLPLQSNTFDTVILGDIIEHVENPSQLLREANRVLKKGGLLILSTPNSGYWWNVIDDWFFFHRVPDPDQKEHLSGWTRRDMYRLLNLRGFKNIKTYGAGGILPLLRLRYRNKRAPLTGWIIIYTANKR